MGISQLELAELLGISKITLARVETLESSLRADVYMNALNVLRGYGVILNTMETAALQVDVSNAALKAALARLKDSSKRRVDKKNKPT